MTEVARKWTKLAVLTGVVLVLHLWLLGGIPKVVKAAPRPAPFVARTVAAEPIRAPETPTPRAAPIPSPKVVSAPPAPRKQEVARIAPRTAAVASLVAASAAASAPAREAAPATRVAGASAATHVAVPPSARWHYDVIAQTKGFQLAGKAELAWRHRDGEYEAQLQMTSTLPFVKPRVQRSTGLVTAQGLAPLRFSDKVRSEEAAHFDREHGSITFSTNKPEAALEPGAQDRLSIVLQLSALFAGSASKYPTGSHITVQTASTKEAEPWTFTVEGAETLDLPGGRTKAVRLTRNPRKEYDTKVELWLAPGQAYAPVRLRLTQPNGDWVDQQWSSTDRG